MNLSMDSELIHRHYSIDTRVISGNCYYYCDFYSIDHQFKGPLK